MPTLSPDDARRRFAAARVARLATVSAEGVPHLVPVVFALETGSAETGSAETGSSATGADDTVLTAVDGKPKRHRDLRRLRNIAENPSVCLLVDRYDDDWTQLWWVRADGRATVHDDASTLERARAALGARYRQHRDDPPDGPVVAVTVTRWSGWAAGDAH